VGIVENAYVSGVSIAATPFPLRAFWPWGGEPLPTAFCRLYPHTAGHQLSRLYEKGRVALRALFERLRVDRGKTTVILPAYGAESLFYAAIAAKLQIALCDVDLADTLFDLNQLESLLKTRRGSVLAAVLPYNWGAIDLEKTRAVHRLLEGDSIVCVDDFAQTQPLGPDLVAYHNRHSAVSLFSFSGTKILSCLRGGLLAFQAADRLGLRSEPRADGAVQRRVYTRHTLVEWLAGEIGKRRTIARRYGKYGVEHDLYPTRISVPYVVLSEGWERVLARLIADHYQALRDTRLAHNKRYLRLFQDTAVQTFKSAQAEAVGARYMVVFPSRELRDACQNRLFLHRFWTSRGFVHMIPHVECIVPYLRDEDKDEHRFPNALALENRLLTFPNHYLMREVDFDLVNEVLRQLAV
jgi:dTDP-4-amino-4,6-dideoxygalactose transaminase